MDSDKRKSVFVYSDELSRFDFGPDHPYKPERSEKARDLCLRYGLLNHPWMEIMNPQSLDENLLTIYHEQEYLDLLRKASRGHMQLKSLQRGIGTEDNPLLPSILEWSLRTAGGTYSAMKSILDNEASVAFNTLGGFHHAFPDHAEGFCFINDIAIAILWSLEKTPDLKVAYVDLDAHHGNGVQHAFYEDKRVLFVSLHESGKSLYPWSGIETEMGTGSGSGFTVNAPLEAGADDEVFDFMFTSLVPPLIRSFGPDIIVAELGADMMISDPLTHLKLTNNSYQRAIRELTGLCPKILALGGGGYDLFKTARCWTLAWSILNNVDPNDEYAGLVGGMMFGPEMEVGSLYDHAHINTGAAKNKAVKEAERVVSYLQKEVFPVHGL